MSDKGLPPVITNWAARAFGTALVAVCLWVGTKYIQKVDAMETQTVADHTKIEQIYEDVKWMRENWERK